MFCLLGGYSVTCCLQRTICIIVVFLTVIQGHVWQVVIQLNHLSTYFYIVILLGQFGTLFIAGWASLRLYQLRCRLTLISSVLVVELQRSVAQSLRSYGLLRFGKFGKKEIIGFLIIKNARFFRLVIRLNLSLLGGWRRGSLHFPSIIMAGGLVRSQCWAYAKSFFFLVHVQVLIVNIVWRCCFSLVYLVLGRTLFFVIYSILPSSKKKC